MTIYLNDDRDYSIVIEGWVRDFMATMDDDVDFGEGRPGDDSGVAPAGVKIIFDGYGYNEETDIEDDTNQLSFAVFVHKTSLTEDFPEHEQTPWALIHRPKEEVNALAAGFEVNVGRKSDGVMFTRPGRA